MTGIQEHTERLVREFDPWDRALAEHSEVFWSVMAALRAAGPAVHSRAHGGFWVIVGYDEVLRATRDWRTFSSASGATLPASPDVPRLPPIEVDPPEHGRWRNLLNPYLTRPAVVRHEPAARRIAAELVDTFVDRGECDLGEDFAWKFVPNALFELLLGVPVEQVPHTRALVRRAVSFDHVDQQRAALDELSEWTRGFLRWRAGQPPRDDVTDALRTGQVGGVSLTTDQVVNTLLLLVMAGMENTSSSICDLAGHLIAEPGLAAVLSAPDAPIDDLVEELARYSSVSFGLSRVTTRDVRVGNVTIPAGERVFLLWASGNRDPAAFPRPEVFDVGRGSRGHLAFGAGPHRCLGVQFARLLLRVAITEITTRLPNLRHRPGAAVTHPPGVVRSTWSMPVLFDPPTTKGPR